MPDSIPDNVAQTVRDSILELFAELQPARAESFVMEDDTELSAQLGFDSLTRLELLQRLEERLSITLPQEEFLTAATVGDLCGLVLRQPKSTTVRARVQTVISQRPGFQAISIPDKAATLNAVLEFHARQAPDRVHTYLLSNLDGVQEISFRELYSGARAIASGLISADVMPGQTVALMLPTGKDFLQSFLGILLAGGVPVPLYPPANLNRIEEHVSRQIAILANCEAVALITVKEGRSLGRFLRSSLLRLKTVATAEDLAMPGVSTGFPQVMGTDLAFIQYTSGSTGMPKGVALTHDNLLANIRAIGKSVQVNSRDVCVSWLPLYHDMGLIGAWLGSLYHGCPLVLMSPLDFLARPLKWLEAISQYRGTISAAPNFAYQLCVQRISASDIRSLDLGSWRIALNGAEPVLSRTIDDFSEKFAAAGFQKASMTPVYGLAENSLAVTIPPPGRGPRYDRVSRSRLQLENRAVPETGTADIVEFVSSGLPIVGHEVKIVDHADRELPDRSQGRLLFRGPSATSGYFKNEEATEKLLSRGWLDSGDLAYVADGELYVTGRVKDVIIRAGRNIYPHEIEDAVGALEGIRKGCVAVFSVTDRRASSEKLVVMAEIKDAASPDKSALEARVKQVTADLVNLPADEVVLVPPRTVLKTSSGKIRRSACRELYESGEMKPRSVTVQFLSLAVQSVPNVLRRGRTLIADYLSTIRFYCVSILLFCAALLVVFLSRDSGRARRATRRLARLLFRASGLPVRFEGETAIQEPHRARGKVIVANHASYLDAVVLFSVLPEDVSFVAKKELVSVPVMGAFLRRLGTLFVERTNAQQGIEDAGQILKRLEEGRTVVFFPEGTFARSSGLRPFRMGAFLTAAKANFPIVPVAISGTRSILRSDQWWIRPGTIKVYMENPLVEQGSEWSRAVALRERARSVISLRCGEPLVDESVSIV